MISITDKTRTSIAQRRANTETTAHNNRTCLPFSLQGAHMNSRTNRSRSSRRTLGFQALEARSMMHADVGLAQNGTLVITAESGGSQVEVASYFNLVQVISRDAEGTKQATTYSRDDVERIEFQGGRGVDKFSNRTAIADTIFGRGGNDVLVGGAGMSYIDGGAGNDVIRGGNGNDTLKGGAGKDTIYGGAGADKLYAGTDQVHDILQGGAGDDQYFQETVRDEVRETLHAELFLDSLKVLQTDDGFLSGSSDEVYLLVSGTVGGRSIGEQRVPGPHAYFSMTEGDQLSNRSLWDGRLEVGQTAQLTVKIKESDTFGDPTIGEFLVTIRNDRGQLVVEDQAVRNAHASDVGRVSFGSGPNTSFTHYQSFYYATGGSAVYETAFDVRGRVADH